LKEYLSPITALQEWKQLKQRRTKLPHVN